jgi:cell division protease FtsH
VKALLAEHKQKLVNLAEALLEHEVLEAGEIRQAIAGELTGSSRKSRSFVRSRAALEAADAKSVPTSEGLSAPDKTIDAPASENMT